MSARLGKQFIVENRGGAGGVVGSELVANAPKDGYTLLIVSLAHAVNPLALQAALRSDQVVHADRAVMVTTPNGGCGQSRSLPVKVGQGTGRAREAEAGRLQYASSGVGTFLHLGGELFKISAGVDLLHVPFKGAGPAMIDVIGGHTQAVVRLGRLDHAACPIRQAAGARRRRHHAQRRRCPTFRPSRRPACRATRSPTGSASSRRPARPSAIVEKLHTEISAALDSPEMQKQFDAAGAVPLRMTPAEFGAHMVAETEKWGRVVKEGKIKAE